MVLGLRSVASVDYLELGQWLGSERHLPEASIRPPRRTSIAPELELALEHLVRVRRLWSLALYLLQQGRDG